MLEDAAKEIAPSAPVSAGAEPSGSPQGKRLAEGAATPDGRIDDGWHQDAQAAAHRQRYAVSVIGRPRNAFHIPSISSTWTHTETASASGSRNRLTP